MAQAKPFDGDRFRHMVLSVHETSTRLGVTPVRVRQLISAGELPATRVGRQWVLQEADVERFSPQRRGRPISEASAWAFLHYLSSEHDGFWDVSREVRAQHALWARQLRDLPDMLRPTPLVGLVRNRAKTVLLSADRDEIPDLRRDPALTISGVSHPEAGLLSNAEVEGYVSRQKFERLRREWLLVPAAPKDANVILHVATAVPAPLPIAAVAADLAEHRGAREQGQASQILGSLLGD